MDWRNSSQLGVLEVQNGYLQVIDNKGETRVIEYGITTLITFNVCIIPNFNEESILLKTTI